MGIYAFAVAVTHCCTAHLLRFVGGFEGGSIFCLKLLCVQLAQGQSCPEASSWLAEFALEQGSAV